MPRAVRRRAIASIARIRFSYTGDHVEWTEPGTLIVRIGAGVDQRNRQVEVTVLNGQQ